MKRKHIVPFLTGASIVCGLAWLGGFNFNSRGESAAWVATFSILFGLMLATFSKCNEQ